MKSQDALLAAWNATRERASEQPAVFDAQRQVQRTFAQVDDEARQFELDLLRKIEPHRVLTIEIGNHPSWPAMLLACLRKQIVALPLEPGSNQAAYQICNAAGTVVASRGSIELRTLDSMVPAETLDRDTSLLKLTSGTTGASRAIAFTSEQLLADCEQICDTMQIGHRDLNYAVVSLSHSYGFSNLLTPLIARGVPMALSNDRMPRAILDGLVATEATVFPGMPLLFQALCEIEEPPPLATLRLCISAGAPLPLSVARDFRAKYQHAVHSFYGSSECGGICYDREALLLEEGFVGAPMERVTLELLESHSEASRVRVRSAAVATRYFPEDEPEKLGAGSFVPDDLLSESADGFRIVGRASDLINVAGKKVNPTDVEAQLLKCDGVREAVVFSRASRLRNEEVVACVVAAANLTEAALLEQCRSALKSWQVPKRVFFVDSLPVNDRGKVSRRALAKQFAAPA